VLKPELEFVLARNLGRVAAPDGLWDRIQHPPVAWATRPDRRLAWALVTAMLVAAAAWGLHPQSASEFRSSEVSQIKSWVKTNTGLDVRFRANPSPSVRLIGARVIGPSAQIRYRVNNHAATLLISRVAPTLVADARHQFLSNRSWTMGGQLYTLECAVPGDSGCLLCHSD
jgi:hypothetical protein